MKAKQTVSNLTEAEAIEQAKEGDARRFRIPLQGALQARLQPVPTHDQESAEAEDLTQQAFLQLFERLARSAVSPFFNLAASSDREHCFGCIYAGHKPAEFPVEDLERYSSNGAKAHLKTVQRHFDARCDRQAEPHARDPQIAGRLQKLFLMHDVIGYEHSEIAGLWDARLRLQVAGAQGSQKNFGDYYRENIGEGGRCRPGMGRSRRRESSRLDEASGGRRRAGASQCGRRRRAPAAVMPAAASRHACTGLRGGRCGVGDRTAVPATSLAVADRSIHPARSPQRHRPVLRVCVREIGLSRRHCSGGWSPRTRAPASLSLTQITPPSCR